MLRRSPGRVRVRAPSLIAGAGAGLARLQASDAVLGVRLSELTGNALIEFDPARIDEHAVLMMIASEPATPPRKSLRSSDSDAPAGPGPGWLQAARAETLRARPAECVAAVLAFERYPEWQSYVTGARVLERDARGRGTRVVTRARVKDRDIEFTASIHFPRPNQIAFEHDDDQFGVMRGSWSFQSAGRGRTRATYALAAKPGWRLSLMMRGPLYGQLREAALDHVMGELRARVEPGQ